MLAALVPVAALPWLQGFFMPEAVSKSSSHDCGGRTTAIVLAADVAGAPGRETIVASYRDGVVVLDREQRPIAQTRGLPCDGGADELVALAVGDAAIGIPLVAIAATTGSARQSRTELTLYRVGVAGGLVPVFSGEVERHTLGTERSTTTGIVTLLPGGLVYRDPSGVTSLWTYEVALGRYRQQVMLGPSA